MHRLFVAIRPPRNVRAQLLGLMGGVRGARWQSDEQLHLTLRFIGQVDRHKASDVHAALGSIHHPRFAIAVTGIQSFDRRGEPVTLWAGVSPQDALKALHKKVDQACLRVGIEPDRRVYTPHITLARLGPGSGPVQTFLESEGGNATPPFPVEEFRLFESQLMSQGAVYEVIERYRLD